MEKKLREFLNGISEVEQEEFLKEFLKEIDNIQLYKILSLNETKKKMLLNLFSENILNLVLDEESFEKLLKIYIKHS